MNLQHANVLVTGGAGFIGSHVVESLVHAGANVTVYDNFSSGSTDNLASVAHRISVIEGDILDLDKLERAMRGMHIVSHQAAQLEITKCLNDPIADLKCNTIGTLNVLRAASRTKVVKVINASSACVYGQAHYIPQDESHPTNPNWPYGVSKLAAEKYCRIFGELHGLNITSLRYAIIYGEREWYGRVLTIFLKRVLEGNPPVIFGEGTQLRDFTYVGDLVRLHNLCIVNEGARGCVFNVSTGVGTSVKELANIILEVTGSDLKPIHEDVAPGARSNLVAEGRMRLPAELDKMVLSCDKAKRLLGWQPRVDLRTGIRREWEWLQANHSRWNKLSY